MHHTELLRVLIKSLQTDFLSDDKTMPSSVISAEQQESLTLPTATSVHSQTWRGRVPPNSSVNECHAAAAARLSSAKLTMIGQGVPWN